VAAIPPPEPQPLAHLDCCAPRPGRQAAACSPALGCGPDELC